jgi:hypoxanthine phosphoribosyltransferase
MTQRVPTLPELTRAPGGPAGQAHLTLLFSREEIAARVVDLAREIRAACGPGELLLVAVLKGAFMFLADLLRALEPPAQVDFVRLASYGMGETTSGSVLLVKDVEFDVRGRDVLVVDDVLDTGLTLAFLSDHLRRRGARSVRLGVLVDKRRRRRVPVEADFVGFTVEDGFVVGYGIDHAERYRELPDLYTVEWRAPRGGGGAAASSRPGNG